MTINEILTFAVNNGIAVVLMIYFLKNNNKSTTLLIDEVRKNTESTNVLIKELQESRRDQVRVLEVIEKCEKRAS